MDANWLTGTATRFSAAHHTSIEKLFGIWYGKAKLLQGIVRFKEAAQECDHILTFVEIVFPEGFPINFFAASDSQKILCLAVELLPQLWKLADCPKEAILSYRRALIGRWNLEEETSARIRKEFAIYLLYSGYVAEPLDQNYNRPNMESLYVPRNNMEEAVLLLMIQLRNFNTEMIKWDPSVRDHLSFALSLSGDLRTLAKQFEEFTLGIDKKDTVYCRALCYHGVGDDEAALYLLRDLFRSQRFSGYMSELVLASKICGEKSENSVSVIEGVRFARIALDLQCGCVQMVSVANWLLGVSLCAHACLSGFDSERNTTEYEGHMALQTARITQERDPKVIFHLSLANAEQRRINTAVFYARQFLDLEANFNIKGWILLARLLSAQKRYSDAEAVIDTGLNETGELDKGDLLRTKAKLQIAQGQLRNAVDTYVHLLAVLEVRKDYRIGKKLQKDSKKHDRSLKMDLWHDMAIRCYTRKSMWKAAEGCLSKFNSVSRCDASKLHAKGLLCEAKGRHVEALRAFADAITCRSNHVPSLVSFCALCGRVGPRSITARVVLSEALVQEYANSSAWYNLGLLCETFYNPLEPGDAAECFRNAGFFQANEPVEPFRSPPLHLY